MVKLLLFLHDEGSKSHTKGAAWGKERHLSVEQLAFGTNRIDCVDEQRAY